ncbi:DUF4250 domain-containing protein [Velocimicrobium porci]|uniref:DUF4250 domain-containing protein n=1 Tax=Velocimicrobium porci TaxID=2606634 RepID=A0A6L5XXN7_9FIRM|nr:DUF4250 domain-containing protein [Velocimicrobium porci]MSS63525.1 DUF4250 domain-containing protein [Velocimicrobium porci]
MTIPNDPVMLLSYINTQLRDYYSNLDILCEELELSKDFIIETLKTIDYEYNLTQNQFV